MYLMLVDDEQRRHYTMADIYSCAEQYITSYRPLLCLIAKKCYEAVPEKSCEKVLDEKARASLAEVAMCGSWKPL